MVQNILVLSQPTDYSNSKIFLLFKTIPRFLLLFFQNSEVLLYIGLLKWFWYFIISIRLNSKVVLSWKI